jgi:acyl carrier protein
MSDDFDRLQSVFRDVFDNPQLVITPESNARNVEGWDSLAHINLVSAIEQEFDIQFTLGELESLKNVGEMLGLMRKKMEKSRP